MNSSMTTSHPICNTHVLLQPILLLALVMLPHIRVGADLYYEQVSTLTPIGTEPQGTATLRLKVYVRPRMVRAEDTSTGKIVICRLDKGVIWGVNEADKTYTELTIKQLKEDWQKAQRTAGIQPPPKSAIRVVEEEREETICGYQCKKSTLFVGDEPIMHVWHTPEIEAPEKEDLYEYTKCLGKFPETVLEQARALSGFPLKVRAVETIGAGKVEAYREVVLIKFDTVNPKLFEIPEGFKKAEIK